MRQTLPIAATFMAVAAIAAPALAGWDSSIPTGRQLPLGYQNQKQLYNPVESGFDGNMNLILDNQLGGFSNTNCRANALAAGVVVEVDNDGAIGTTTIIETQAHINAPISARATINGNGC